LELPPRRALAFAPRHLRTRSSGRSFRPIKNNPSLNAQRAADENVPQALSGYRPKLSVTASGGFNYFREVNKSVNQQVFPNSVNYTSRYPAIRRDCDANAFQRIPNRQSHASSRKPGDGRA